MADFIEQITGSQLGNTLSRTTLDEEGIVNIGANISIHEAMKEGVNPRSKKDRGKSISPGISGYIDVSQSVEFIKTYREILFDDQEKDIRKDPTSNYAIDTGMKRNSKVVISIVPENSNINNASWDQRLQGNLKGGKVVFPHFSVQSISEPNEERYQIHETIGADFIQSFGTRPRIFMISGSVVNGKVNVGIGNQSRSMDWKNAFQRIYKRRFSLKRCIHRREKIRIFGQSTIWDGYVVNLISQTSANMASLSQVTITFVMSDESYLGQNDDEIPGIINDGMLNTGVNTPITDILPTPNLNDYFNEYSDEDINERVENKESELEKIENRVDARAGRFGQEVIEELKELDSNSMIPVSFGDVTTIKVHEAIANSENLVDDQTKLVEMGQNIEHFVKGDLEKLTELCVKYIELQNEINTLKSY